MNILYVDYTLQNNSLDIYVSGCGGNPHCEGCHNPKSWDFDQGVTYDLEYFKGIRERVESFDLLIKNIMIFGGEPLDQNHDELLHLLVDLNLFNKKMWLFTRYNLSEVPKEFLKLCDYVKCGKYDSSLIVDNNIQFGIKLATSNQKNI